MNALTFSIHRCQDWCIRPTVERYHYLKRWPDPRSLPFGYALRVDDKPHALDGRPWGLLVFKKPQHHRQRALFGYDGLPTAWQVLDLARVWVHPELQGRRWAGVDRNGKAVEHSLCVFSRMVAMSLKRLQADWIEHHPPVFPELPYHLLLVISYCELSHHDGTGYQASGFEKFGKTNDGTKELYVRRLHEPRWKFSAKPKLKQLAFEMEL